MDIRQAILKAADHIERQPHLFSFKEWLMPNDCGSPGCAIGWIGVFSETVVEKSCHDGIERRSGVASDVCPAVLGIKAEDFYDRMDSIDQTTDFDKRWRRNAGTCARSLRAYADKYHPDASRALIPDNVARIFRMSHAELARELETV